MATATLAILVSVVLASAWAGVCCYLIARFTARSIQIADHAANEIVGDEPTVFAPVFQFPSRRVATLRAINSLVSLNADTTNDVEDVTAATVAA